MHHAAYHRALSCLPWRLADLALRRLRREPKEKRRPGPRRGGVFLERTTVFRGRSSQLLLLFLLVLLLLLQCKGIGLLVAEG